MFFSRKADRGDGQNCGAAWTFQNLCRVFALIDYLLRGPPEFLCAYFRMPTAPTYLLFNLSPLSQPLLSTILLGVTFEPTQSPIENLCPPQRFFCLDFTSEEGFHSDHSKVFAGYSNSERSPELLNCKEPQRISREYHSSAACERTHSVSESTKRDGKNHQSEICFCLASSGRDTTVSRRFLCRCESWIQDSERIAE